MITRLVAFVVLLLASGTVPVQAAGDMYALRHGDRLQISVWREEALNREVRVLPDGSIGFPLVGRIAVSGLSTPEIEKRIIEGLKPYIPEAVVSVVVTGTEGHSVHVIGKVLKPGQILLSSPETTVLQALSQAGGLDRFASGDAIMVMRRLAGGNGSQTFRVRYNELIRGEALETNVLLRPGDTILVP